MLSVCLKTCVFIGCPILPKNACEKYNLRPRQLLVGFIDD